MIDSRIESRGARIVGAAVQAVPGKGACLLRWQGQAYPECSVIRKTGRLRCIENREKRNSLTALLAQVSLARLPILAVACATPFILIRVLILILVTVQFQALLRITIDYRYPPPLQIQTHRRLAMPHAPMAISLPLV